MHSKWNTPTALIRGQKLRHILPIVIGGLCLWLLIYQLEPGSLKTVPEALKSIPLRNWIAAILATALSFWALGRYDVIVHRQLGTNIKASSAALSGASAIAIGQVLGMGILTGTIVRWRVLPDLSGTDAGRITAAVTASFMICLAGIVGMSALMTGMHLIPVWAAMMLSLVPLVIMASSLVQPILRIGSHQVKLPPLPAITHMFLLILVDTAAAATALYFLLPPGTSLDWSLLYVAYILALSGALLSGTPGGVGPFELVLVAILPAVDEPALLGAVVAFRLVYYALPALIALPLLAYPIKGAIKADPYRATPPCQQELAQAKRAELGVCRQNHAQILTTAGARLAVIRTPQSITALFDPLSAPSRDMFRGLAWQARNQNRCALVYKCSARIATLGRKAGWSTLHIADEAVLDPARFSPDGPAFRQLRRKLRQAQNAGVEASSDAPLPLAMMKKIDAQWLARQGPARGASMGRYCEQYLKGQQVYLATHRSKVVGFVSFHIGATEMCLDLMRTADDAPSGTMHLLVRHAIQQASLAGHTRLSLAAIPRELGPDCPAILASCAKIGQSRGLAQFKTTFDPRREPLYALAPSWVSLFLGLADMVLAIRFPPINRPQDHHEEKEFARMKQTCKTPA